MSTWSDSLFKFFWWQWIDSFIGYQTVGWADIFFLRNTSIFKLNLMILVSFRQGPSSLYVLLNKQQTCFNRDYTGNRNFMKWPSGSGTESAVSRFPLWVSALLEAVICVQWGALRKKKTVFKSAAVSHGFIYLCPHRCSGCWFFVEAGCKFSV